jgi:hypothetical protein
MNRVVGEVSLKTTSWGKAVLVGLAAGLAATVVVDAIMMSLLRLSGQPVQNGFVLIGDTAAGFLAKIGIHLAGGVPLGLAIHFFTGLVLGVLFAGLATGVPTLRKASRPKMAGVGVVYTELISIPLLVWPPIILGMAQPDAVGWFSVTASLHAVFGLVLGLAVSFGLRAPVPAGPPAAGPVR